MFTVFKEKVPEISYHKLKSIIEDNKTKLFIIDVRDKIEQQISKIPNAISKYTFTKEFEEYPEKFSNSVIVVYCTIGFRSGIFAQEFLKKNTKTLKNLNIQVLNFKGSILEWIHYEELEYENEKNIGKVHCYSNAFDIVPENYKTVKYPFFRKMAIILNILCCKKI